MASVASKRNYRCQPSLQQFYGGGPLAMSSDGSFIACACGEAIKIVDSSNASIRASIDAESDAITALVLSPDDKFLFSAGHTSQIKVWDLSTFKCIRSWKGHEGPVMGMACHPSGGFLATAGADRKVLVWNVDGGFCTQYFKGHKGVVSSILFHPDSSKDLLFSGSDDTTVRVWDLSTKKGVATLNGHNSTVTSVALSDDRETLLTAGRDKVVMLWDLRDYSCKKTVLTYEALEALCVIRPGTPFALSLGVDREKITKKKKSESQGIYFLTVGERGVVRIWNSERAACLYQQKSSDITVNTEEDDAKRGFSAAFMLPGNQGLLCVTVDQQFLFYSLEKKPEGMELVLGTRLVGYNEEIVDMKFLGNEEQFLAVATNTEQVRVYNLESMSCQYVLAGHTETVLCVDTCVSSSGRTLVVTGSKDKNVRLWEAGDGNCIGVGTGHTGSVGAVAISKKGKGFFISGSSDRTLKVWNWDDLVENEEPAQLKARAVVAAHDKDINSLAIAPNDSLVCSGSQDRTACVWTLPDLIPKVTLKGHKRGIWSVEFSPVDQCVITSSGDKTIKIWAISDGSCLKTFEGHTSSVLRVSFITRGTQFVSCGADGLVKLWTVNTNECIATYDQHEDKVWALAVGKKTEMLATGGGDAVVNLWYDSTASDKEEAFLKKEEGVLKGQELENALLDADYIKAIRIAFELRRPHKLYELFAALCRKKDVGSQIQKALKALSTEELQALLEYIREWNTKTKLCHVAQFVLYKFFNTIDPTDIIKIKGIGDILEGLLPYSQRHYTRADRLVRNTFLLDFTLAGMSVIEPETNQSHRKEKPSPESVPNGWGDVEAPEEELKSKSALKKRKSDKNRDRSHKKAKGVAYTSVAAAFIKTS